MQKLQTVNADTLLYEPLEKPSFVVDGLIPTGLTLFCGSQKIGKSWLMLKLCLCVSQGIPLWDMPTREGDVLYLCLEDTFCRIQDRLFRLTDEASGRLHFAVASDKLSDGLIVQLEDYLKEYLDSRLIVIDTLQKVRTASKDNAYASDYGDISLIKDFADRHSLAVIVVHHIRKQNDSDVFNKVSGTTGLCVDVTDDTRILECTMILHGLHGKGWDIFVLKSRRIWYLSIKCGILKIIELIGGVCMTVDAAWDYAIGMIKVDGLEPTEDFKKYIELEKNGQATTKDLKKYLDKKYKVKQDA